MGVTKTGNKNSLAEETEMGVKRQKRRKDWPLCCKHFQASPCLICQHKNPCGGVLFACNRQVMSRKNSVAPR